LYTLIDEGGDKMYFYTPYGGDGIIDEDKFDTLADQICEKISSLHQDESHGRAGIYWTPVGTYNGTTYVQRYGGSLQLDNGEYLIRDNGTESFHILTTD
jgi:hypothetical protein